MLVSTMKDLTAKVFDDYTVYRQSFAVKVYNTVSLFTVIHLLCMCAYGGEVPGVD